MNEKLIVSDGVNLYVTLESNIKGWVKVVLIVLNIVLYTALFGILFSLEKEEIGSFIFPFLMIFGGLFFLLTRTTLWNMYGREQLIINRKTFSYLRDYGWFRSNLKTVSIHGRLRLMPVEAFTHTEDPYFSIVFLSFDENDLQTEIMTTAIKISSKTLEEIKEGLQEIFTDDLHQHISFSLN